MNSENKSPMALLNNRRYFFKMISLAAITGITAPAWGFSPIKDKATGSASKAGIMRRKVCGD